MFKNIIWHNLCWDLCLCNLHYNLHFLCFCSWAPRGFACWPWTGAKFALNLRSHKYVMEGNPSFPLYILWYCFGHLSHALWTQSTIPMHPARQASSCSVFMHHWLKPCVDVRHECPSKKELSVYFFADVGFGTDNELRASTSKDKERSGDFSSKFDTIQPDASTFWCRGHATTFALPWHPSRPEIMQTSVRGISGESS